MSTKGPLAELRVIEMAGLGPVPLAGQLLCDLGADVVVIDRTARPADPTEVNRRGKRSVLLDLKTPAGLAAARRLIASADMLIEGFRPGVMERLGVGPDVCIGDNDSLIYGRMTGWGQDGPFARMAGHDINYLALTGALHAMGSAAAPPMPPLNLVADYGGGTMMLLFGLLAALHERSRSSQGQVVDAAMVDGVVALLGLIHGARDRGDWNDARESNRLDGGAPFYRCYETADGRYVAVGALEDAFFVQLTEGLGLSGDVVADRMNPSRWPEIAALFVSVFATRTRDEWAERFAKGDACVTPVLGFDEAADHPQMAARANHQRIAGVLQSAPTPRFSRTPPVSPAPPRARGGDTAFVFTSVEHAGEFSRWFEPRKDRS